MKNMIFCLFITSLSFNALSYSVHCKDNLFNEHELEVDKVDKDGKFEYEFKYKELEYRYVVNVKENSETSNYYTVSDEKYKMTYALTCSI